MTTIVSEFMAFDFKEEPATVLEVISDRQTTRSKELNKQRNSKKLLEPTDASKIFQRCLAVLSLFGTLIGADTKYEWKLNLRFVILMVVTVPFISSQFLYTQFLYLYQHDNMMRNLEVIAMYGVVVSCFLKIKCFVKYYTNIAALYNSTLKICMAVGGLRAEKLKSRLLASLTFYKCISCLAILIIVLYSFYPVKSYIYDGVLVPLMPMEIMFIDQSTQLGFVSANIVMLMLGVYALSILMYMAMNFIILATSYTIRGDIVEIDFSELDELWSDTSTSTIAHRHMFLRNICEKCIDMRGYIYEIKKIFDEKLFLFFIFAYLSQILCLYEIRVAATFNCFIPSFISNTINDWIPGYAVAVGMFLEMILYCLMGTQISVQNKRLCEIISQSKWYTYDNHSQKILMTLLNLAMNCPELWIGPLKPLSVFTAIEIIKSIFSYYTIMLKLL